MIFDNINKVLFARVFLCHRSVVKVGNYQDTRSDPMILKEHLK